MVNLSICRRGQNAKPERGFTLMELIIAATILAILTMMALPMARMTIQRQKEKELRRALWEMRDAIDTYKQAGERGAFQIKADSGGYPPDLRNIGERCRGARRQEDALPAFDSNRPYDEEQRVGNEVDAGRS